jgi:tetratricopeptide (TPR) repeat protein
VTIHSNGTFDLVLKLLEYPNQKLINSIRKKESLDVINQAVHEAATKLIETVLLTINSSNKDDMPLIPLPEPGELEALASAFSKEANLNPKERVALFSALWRDNPSFSSVATQYLLALNQSGDHDQIEQALHLLNSIDPPTVTFDIYRSLYNCQLSANGIDPESIANLKDIIINNPNVIVAWFALNNAYINETVMYTSDNKGMTYVISPALDHHLGYASAIAISMAAVRRWPNYYRAWWGLSSNLMSYANLVRGTKYWRDIPEKTRRRYNNIMALADDSLYQAIKRHPAQASLYLNKISLDINQGRDWRESFEMAAKLRPHDANVYVTAFNFSRPQWGGSKQDMRDVYDLAKHNNPDAEWPHTLRDQWAPEIKPFLDLSSTKIQLILIVSLLLVFYWLWKRQDNL